MVQDLLTLARQFNAKGNFAAAEVACRKILDTDPRNSGALHILGLIAGTLGLRTEAIGYLEASIRGDIDNPTIRSDLDRARTMPALQWAEKQLEPKYLLIKAWGYGFWSDVSHVLGCLLLAEITERIPVTYWGTNSLFGNGSSKDAFCQYFEPVSNATLNEITQIPNADFFPPKWHSGNLTAENLEKWEGKFSRLAALFYLRRPERIAVSDFYIGCIDILPWIPRRHPMYKKSLSAVYQYLIKKYLRPQKPILGSCEAFFSKEIGGMPFVAIHLRGSDKAIEMGSVEAPNRDCLSALDSVDPSWRIFVLTDDNRWLSHITSLHGTRVVATTCQRSGDNTGVHYMDRGSGEGLSLGNEVMTDTYIALRASRFIGNGQSNVSTMISFMKNWGPGNCTLVRPSPLMERNISIHIR